LHPNFRERPFHVVGWIDRVGLSLGRSDTLPNQVGGTLDSPEQYRPRAQDQSVPRHFHEALLLGADPVGNRLNSTKWTTVSPRNSYVPQ
jgi:hypothetical protein